MTEPQISRARAWIFGVAALGVTLVGWLCFVLSFTAHTAAWYNSLTFFIAIYLIAVALSLRGIRSIVGIVALVLAIPSLGIVCLLAFG
jgi:hypothetical protein